MPVPNKTLSKKVPAKAQKIFVPFDVSDPASEPLFVNHCEISRFGTDVFIDVGVIPAEDLRKSREVKFFVLERLAMSADSFATLFEKARKIFEDLG